MRNLFVRYISLLLFLFILGITFYGGNTAGEVKSISKDVSDKYITSATSLSSDNQSYLGAMECCVSCAKVETVVSREGYSVSDFLFHLFQSSRVQKSASLKVRRAENCFQVLLGSRYIHGFYIYSLRKIII